MSEEIEGIERDLKSARENLRSNVHALSEKLTLGRIIDEFVLESKVDWDALGSEAGKSAKVAIPGAILGAGVALLLANGNLGSLMKSGSRSDTASDYEPSSDWNVDNRYRSIEFADRDVQRRNDEDDAAYSRRLSEHYAKALGHVREPEEDDRSFHDRVTRSVEELKKSAAGARHRLAGTFSESMHKAANAGEGVMSAVAGAPHAASELARKAGAAVKGGGRQLESLVQQNPVFSLAIGLGIGALLGAITPMSQTEEKMLERPVRDVVNAAANVADKIAEKASTTDQSKATGSGMASPPESPAAFG